MTKKTYYYIANYSKKGELVSLYNTDEFGMPFVTQIPKLYESEEDAIDAVDCLDPYDPASEYGQVQRCEIKIPKMTQLEMNEVDNKFK